jgi:type II secretory pathway component GspD/PulD (secretin)
MTSKLFVGCLIATAAFAQTTGVDGTFHFTSPQTPQSLQEAATILRTVADIPQLSVDSSLSTLTFHGPADKVAFAQWMLGELDRPGGETALHEYPMANGEVARVNFLTNVQTAQGMQEVLTVLRTVADLAKAFNFSSRQAIVMRGSEGTVAFSEWILDQLNLPAQHKPDAAPREYTITDNPIPRSGSLARVNYLTNVSTPRGMQEILSTLRIVGEIQKIFTYTNQRALVLRGNDSDIARAEWLIQNLDQQPGQQAAGAHVFNATAADDVTRIFYLANATPQGLQTAVTAIRTEAKVRHVSSTSAPSAVVVRGTSDQVEAAAQIIAAGNGLALLR